MRPGGSLPLKGATPAAWQNQIRGVRLRDATLERRNFTDDVQVSHA